MDELPFKKGDIVDCGHHWRGCKVVVLTNPYHDSSGTWLFDGKDLTGIDKSDKWAIARSAISHINIVKSELARLIYG